MVWSLDTQLTQSTVQSNSQNEKNLRTLKLRADRTLANAVKSVQTSSHEDNLLNFYYMRRVTKKSPANRLQNAAKLISLEMFEKTVDPFPLQALKSLLFIQLNIKTQ